VGGAVLFACLLLINVAGHGYERESFQSKKFNLTSQGFPGTFLRDSSRQDDCEAHRIQTGNGMPRLSDF
jgi:hypothetical protein